MQNAHWNPCSSTTACCTGCSVPSSACSPSTVCTPRPRTWCVSIEQEYCGTPSMSTVQAPHSDRSQPIFVPVSPSL